MRSSLALSNALLREVPLKSKGSATFSTAVKEEIRL